jgi:polysaccharide biosynthesis protein PslH
MRILMLSPYLPWPLDGGPPVRIYYVLRELAQRGHEIVLLAGYEGPPLPASHPVVSLCREVLTYQPPASARPGSPLFSALHSLFSPLPYVAAKFGARHIGVSIRRAAERHAIDLIWANFAFMAYAVPPEVYRSVPLVLDEHESEGLLWRQYWRRGSLPKRVFAALNLIKLPAFQKRIMAQVAAVLSNSEREASFTRKHAPPGVRIWAAPNGVDTERFAPAPEGIKKNSILLCSGLAVYRNRAAAQWFARRMFPRIRGAVPDAEFWIVGSHPTREIRRLEQCPGIHVTGTVEDVRPYYAMARVAVAPYRYGEGTKIKVVEAMACGLPMVTTPTGCQGLEVIDGRHLMVAANEADFSRRVVELLRDRERARSLGAAARALAVEKYSWQGLISEVEAKLMELVDTPREKTCRLGACERALSAG